MKNIFTMDAVELADYMKAEEFNELLNHTRARHINRAPDYLKARLIGPTRLTFSSTFCGDERYILMFIRNILYRNAVSIHQWLHSGSKTAVIRCSIPKQIGCLKYEAYGRSSIREASCSQIRIILDKRETERGYMVKITAYPT